MKFYIHRIVDDNINKFNDKDVKQVLSQYCFCNLDYGFETPELALKDGQWRYKKLGIKFEVIEIEVVTKVTDRNI